MPLAAGRKPRESCSRHATTAERDAVALPVTDQAALLEWFRVQVRVLQLVHMVVPLVQPTAIRRPQSPVASHQSPVGRPRSPETGDPSPDSRRIPADIVSRHDSSMPNADHLTVPFHSQVR